MRYEQLFEQCLVTRTAGVTIDVIPSQAEGVLQFPIGSVSQADFRASQSSPHKQDDAARFLRTGQRVEQQQARFIYHRTPLRQVRQDGQEITMASLQAAMVVEGDGEHSGSRRQMILSAANQLRHIDRRELSHLPGRSGHWHAP
jgi:hypothetical protein